jgi:hypothetical protein
VDQVVDLLHHFDFVAGQRKQPQVLVPFEPLDLADEVGV